MASTNISYSGDTGVIGVFAECIDNGSENVTLSIQVKRIDDANAIDGTYSISGDYSASGAYVLRGTKSEIWSKTFNVDVNSSGEANVDINFTIKATAKPTTSPTLKTVTGSITKLYLNDDSGDSGDSDSSGSGDSGSSDSGSSSSGSTTSGSSKLYIVQGEGTVVTVERTWSDYGDYTKDGNQVFLKNGDTIYYPADRFEITAYAEDDYEIDYYDFEGERVPFELTNFTFSSGGTKYKLASNGVAYIATTAGWTGNDEIDPDDPGGSGGNSGGSGSGSGGTDIPTDGTYWLIKKTTLVDFANQARRLGDISGDLDIDQMLDIFESVGTGSDSTNPDGTPSDPVLQDITVISNGEYTPSSGYDGFSKVTVNVESITYLDGEEATF